METATSSVAATRQTSNNPERVLTNERDEANADSTTSGRNSNSINNINDKSDNTTFRKRKLSDVLHDHDSSIPIKKKPEAKLEPTIAEGSYITSDFYTISDGIGSSDSVNTSVSSLSGNPESGSANSSRSSSSTRSRKYICDYEGCGKAYTKPSLLEQHKRSHENIRPYKCAHEGCDKAFFRKSHLDIHLLSHKSSDEKPYSCKICGKGVNTRQHLKRHEITHSKSFKCSFHNCEVTFYKNYQLKNHILAVHENKLTCADCGKSFPRPYRLANHREKIHGSQPSYQCTNGNCLSMFKTWSALQFHIKTIHPKIKCELCGKACVGEAGLRMHMIVHDDAKIIKIWNCKICPSTFPRKVPLIDHYQAEHKNVPLPESLLQDIPIRSIDDGHSSSLKHDSPLRGRAPHKRSSLKKVSPLQNQITEDDINNSTARPNEELDKSPFPVKLSQTKQPQNDHYDDDDTVDEEDSFVELSQEPLNSGNVSDSSTGSRKSLQDILHYSPKRSVLDIIAYQGEKLNKTIPCKYANCDRMFKNEYDLRRHLNWHEGMKLKFKQKKEEVETQSQNTQATTGHSVVSNLRSNERLPAIDNLPILPDTSTLPPLRFHQETLTHSEISNELTIKNNSDLNTKNSDMAANKLAAPIRKTIPISAIIHSDSPTTNASHVTKD